MIKIHFRVFDKCLIIKYINKFENYNKYETCAETNQHRSFFYTIEKESYNIKVEKDKTCPITLWTMLQT